VVTSDKIRAPNNAFAVQSGLSSKKFAPVSYTNTAISCFISSSLLKLKAFFFVKIGGSESFNDFGGSESFNDSELKSGKLPPANSVGSFGGFECSVLLSSYILFIKINFHEV